MKRVKKEKGKEETPGKKDKDGRVEKGFVFREKRQSK